MDENIMTKKEICEICEKEFNKDDFHEHLIEEHTKHTRKLRPATSTDIILNNIIFYPENRNYSLKVERIIQPNHSFSAFMSGGYRYGLDGAFVEIFTTSDTPLKESDYKYYKETKQEYTYALNLLENLMINFGKDRWFSSFELLNISDDMLYILEEIYDLNTIKVNNITYYKHSNYDDDYNNCDSIY